MRVAILLIFLLTGCAKSDILSEVSHDVSFGFREVSQEVEMTEDHWEGIGHFRFLYYENIELSQTTIYSVSPDGNYALFQDGPTGDIVLFNSKSESKSVALKFAGFLASGFKWDLENNMAQVSFRNGKLSKVILSAKNTSKGNKNCRKTS